MHQILAKADRNAAYIYLKQCYLILKSLDNVNRTIWATKVRNLLCRYGFGHVWLALGVVDIDSFVMNFKTRLKIIHYKSDTLRSRNLVKLTIIKKNFKYILRGKPTCPKTYLQNTSTPFPSSDALLINYMLS